MSRKLKTKVLISITLVVGLGLAYTENICLNSYYLENHHIQRQQPGQTNHMESPETSFSVYSNFVTGEGSYSCRSLYIFLAPEYFTEDSLKKFFLGLSDQYRSPDCLSIMAYSNESDLKREMTSGMMVEYSARPGFNSPLEMDEKSMPTLRARYSREDGSESFSYTPASASDKAETVIIKKRPVQYSGNINLDLLVAIKEGDIPKVSALLAEGADPSTREIDGYTSLIVAALNKNRAIVQLLLSRGADANLSGSDGLTALQVAASDGENEIVEDLLLSGAKVNAKDKENDSALDLAAYHGRDKTIQILLDWGAYIDSRDSDGNTPLMQAAMNGHAKVVRLLLNKGARVNAKNNNGETALMLAHRDEGTLEHLLSYGADINAKSKKGWTPLMYAAYSYHENKARMLLAKGANVALKTNRGETVLHIAQMRNGNDRIIHLLKEAGAVE